MSAILVLVAVAASLLSVLAIVPHFIQALQRRRPGGSATGWAFGALCNLLWLIYGLLIGNPIVGAPGWVTVPIGVTLAVWCWRTSHTPSAASSGAPMSRTPTPHRVVGRARVPHCAVYRSTTPRTLSRHRPHQRGLLVGVRNDTN